MTALITASIVILLGLLAAIPVLRAREARRPMRARGSAPIRGDEGLARKVAIVAALREAVQRRGFMEVRMPQSGETRGSFNLAFGGRGSFRVLRERRKGSDYVVELEALAEAPSKGDDGDGEEIRAA